MLLRTPSLRGDCTRPIASRMGGISPARNQLSRVQLPESWSRTLSIFLHIAVCRGPFKT